MNILIISNSDKVDKLINLLMQTGYTNIDSVYNGLDGIDRVLTKNYDIVVLDIFLPKISGWDVLQTISSTRQQVPILLLSDKDQVEWRIRGLELGADDYLAKPFSFQEFLARMKALVRRSQQHRIEEEELYIIDDLQLNWKRHYVMRGNKSIQLTSKEFSLLALLMQHAGKPLSRTFIISHVWDINFDNQTNVVDVAIKRLRNKIDQGFQTKLIHSVRGTGYVLEKRT